MQEIIGKRKLYLKETLNSPDLNDNFNMKLELDKIAELTLGLTQAKKN